MLFSFCFSHMLTVETNDDALLINSNNNSEMNLNNNNTNNSHSNNINNIP